MDAAQKQSKLTNQNLNEWPDIKRPWDTKRLFLGDSMVHLAHKDSISELGRAPSKCDAFHVISQIIKYGRYRSKCSLHRSLAVT